MRQIVIDGLSPEERANLDSYLKRSIIQAPINGLFWLPVPADLLGDAQRGHDDCGPFHFGVDLAEESVSFELLVRSERNLHCSCISYATDAQREFLMRFIDRMLEEERIKA